MEVDVSFSMKSQTTGMPKKKTGVMPSGLTETEQDLVSHLQNGFQLETDSLGGDPLLRRLKDSEVIRPLSATRHTVKALKAGPLTTICVTLVWMGVETANLVRARE